MCFKRLHCNGINIMYKIGSKMVKIASQEIYNLKLINSCLEKFEKVIISTGASRWEEILKLTDVKNKEKIIVMHCVSSYPCKAENVNMPKMKKLQDFFPIVGYSGHFAGIDDAIIALCNGAAYIEKHFTIDRNLPGRDNKFAILPDEMMFLTSYIKEMNYSMIERKNRDINETKPI